MKLTLFSPSFNESEALGFHDKRPAYYYRLMFPYPEC